MKKILIIYCLFALSSCSFALVNRMSEKKGVDPTFHLYIEKYKQIIKYEKYKYRFENMSMNFGDLESKDDKKVIGRCKNLLSGEAEILIDRTWWFSNSTALDREFTIYHELEHCIRYRPHTDLTEKVDDFSSFFERIGYYLGLIRRNEMLIDGCPYSIMHSTTFDYYCQQKNYDHYIKEIKEWR